MMPLPMWLMPCCGFCYYCCCACQNQRAWKEWCPSSLEYTVVPWMANKACHESCENPPRRRVLVMVHGFAVLVELLLLMRMMIEDSCLQLFLLVKDKTLFGSFCWNEKDLSLMWETAFSCGGVANTVRVQYNTMALPRGGVLGRCIFSFERSGIRIIIMYNVCIGWR